MLESALLFLKTQLNNYLKLKTDNQGFEAVFLQERTSKDISLRNDAIAVLLINLEEEYTLRSGANPQSQMRAISNNPHLHLNLYVIFAANFSDYSQSLKFLSLIIKFFQSHRFFNSSNYPDLNSEIQKLTVELLSIPFSEQRDIWSYLGMSYMPSVIYKVRMVTFADTEAISLDSKITETQVVNSNV